MNLQQTISREKNEDLIGQKIRVVVDRKEGEYFIGRTEYDSPEVDNEVLISSVNKLKPGSFYEVKITGADDFDLYAVQ